MANLRFAGGATFEAATGEVERNGTITRLEPQPAVVLSLLVRRAGTLVTHDEIKDAVWGHATHVDFRDGVHYCIRQIRSALGDPARASRLIVTVPKRGYRLNADALVGVSNEPADAGAAWSSGPSANAARRRSNPWAGGWRQRVFLTTFAVGLAIAIIAVERRPNNHHETAVAVLKAVHDIVY